MKPGRALARAAAAAAPAAPAAPALVPPPVAFARGFASAPARLLPAALRQKHRPEFLTQILERNALIASATERANPDFYRTRARSPQTPHALLVACSDSRLPDSIVADARVGEVFVLKNVANQVQRGERAAWAAVEFAVGVLGVESIVVLGHDGCGGVCGAHALAQHELAVKAGSTLPPPSLPPTVNQWIQPIKESIARLVGPPPVGAPLQGIRYDDPLLKTLVERNVRQQVDNLVYSDFIQSEWKKGRLLSIHGWVYALHTGLIRDLFISRDGSDSAAP